ncbi:DUF3224 domain-containing protein [Amycolatopsis suaedae]|uniref:DUF3224 domain-containing protein n=1 Tax=Amycolatopsis suaedae TaxID=2510978 RepID=A0A4Q7J764_9PSEU|nr:DUF3224 domain-containing protein [Amycolatopsis suaedae]RZQ62622.1 DUF3224 domain-containing protein [Amycolatopsis suaedae]
MSENTYRMISWEENVVSGEENGPRYAHARARMAYTGVIEGESTVDYLMFYSGAGYVGDHPSPGLERIEGSVAGRKGSFVIRHVVDFDATGIAGRWTVLSGSGTGELAGLSGTGTIGGTHGEKDMPYTFDYSF